jgi:hypothetical protein
MNPKNSKKLFENLKLVANGDKHYSPARIAGSDVKNISSLKTTNNSATLVARPSSERARSSQITRRFSPGYNVGHLR